MLVFVARRVGLGILTLWAVSVLIFLGTETLPGDVATALLGQSATPEAVAAIRLSLHLDEPVIWRYLGWLGDALHGNLGISLASRRPVTDQLGFRLYNTLILAATTAIIAVPLALALGIAAAINRNGIFDRVVNSATLAAISLPEFFIGYLLILAFSVKLGVLPSFSSVSPNLGLGDRLYYIALPTLSLVMVVLAHMMRMTRAAIISVMSYPFIEMAILKGLPPWRVVVQHALPNALAPIINVVAMNLAYLVVGVIVIEVVFVYPGIGQLMVDAVSKRDLPLVQACGLIFSIVYVSLNILADVLAIGVNPQMRRRL